MCNAYLDRHQYILLFAAKTVQTLFLFVPLRKQHIFSQRDDICHVYCG